MSMGRVVVSATGGLSGTSRNPASSFDRSSRNAHDLPVGMKFLEVWTSVFIIMHAFVTICDIIYGRLTTMVDGAGPRGKTWCFTMNNYTNEDQDRLRALVPDSCEYLVYGREVGDSGTPHLQGFVKFSQRKRRTQVTAIIGQSHLTLARNVPASILYCKKDGDFEEFGEHSVTNIQGRRNDLDEFKAAVLGGMHCLKDIRETHSEVYAKYPRFCLEFLQDKLPPKAIEPHPLRPWQQDLNAALNLEPDDRTITFIVDLTGNTGKTWFAHYYASLHPRTQVMQPGKKADMSYALDPTIRVLFIDAPRSKQGEYLQYDFLEDCKNGYVFSPKYESRTKQLQKIHLVVNMNESPDMTKLSMDRYNIVQL